MKIQDLLIDTLRRTKIFKMARSKSEAIDKVTDLQDTFVHHLIKVIFLSNDTQNRWHSEMNDYIEILSKLKIIGSKTEFLSSADFFNILFTHKLGHAGGITGEIQQIISKTSDWKNTQTEIDEDQILEKIKQIVELMSNDFSQGIDRNYVAGKILPSTKNQKPIQQPKQDAMKYYLTQIGM